MPKLSSSFAAALLALSALSPAHVALAEGPVKTALSADAGAAEQAVPPATEKAIKEAFTKLNTALAKGDGKAAVSLVTKGTLALYDESRQLALATVDLNTVKQGQVRILMALQFRYLRTRAQLQKATGATMFDWAVKSGLVSQETLAGLELDTIKLDKDKAIATVKKDAQTVPGMQFFFMQEGGKWRLDMVPIVLMAEKQLEQVREDSKKSKTELAIYLMEETHKKKIPPEILKGPLK